MVLAHFSCFWAYFLQMLFDLFLMFQFRKFVEYWLSECPPLQEVNTMLLEEFSVGPGFGGLGGKDYLNL